MCIIKTKQTVNRKYLCLLRALVTPVGSVQGIPGLVCGNEKKIVLPAHPPVPKVQCPPSPL